MNARKRYQELALESARYGDKDSCAVIAMAAALNVDYRQAYALLAKFGRVHRQGTYGVTTFNALTSIGVRFFSIEGLENKSVHTLYPQLKRCAARYDGVLAFTGQHIAFMSEFGLVDFDAGHRKIIQNFCCIDFSECGNDFSHLPYADLREVQNFKAPVQHKPKCKVTINTF